MDLGTVRVNVARGRWSTGEDISEGCNLTFNNAITYNGKSTAFYWNAPYKFIK